MNRPGGGVDGRMNLQKYEAFLKTVECGSFTRAAQALGYTQSGVSHTVSSLEEDWGVALLVRDRAGVRLTSEGERLLPLVRRICRMQEELAGEVEALHGLESGLIRIGTFSSVAVHWLPHMIKAFHAEYPKVDFELLYGDYTEIEGWAAEGRVDFGFLRLPAGSGFEKLESVFLREDRLLAVLPEGHPLAGCGRFPVSQLAEEPFILPDVGLDNDVEAIFRAAGIRPNVRFTAKDDYTIVSMVESGLGISVLPELVMRRTSYRVVRKELDPPAVRRLGVVLRSLRAASSATRRFLGGLQGQGARYLD